MAYNILCDFIFIIRQNDINVALMSNRFMYIVAFVSPFSFLCVFHSASKLFSLPFLVYQCNTEVKFTILPKNAQGVVQRVFVQLQSMIKGPDGRPIKATVVPQDDGTYHIFCTPTLRGQYTVQLLENAEPVHTSPAEIFLTVYGDESEDANIKKGIMRVLVADDAVLKQLGLNSTVKTVKISENTTNTELKDLVLKHMSRGMNDRQLKGIYAFEEIR